MILNEISLLDCFAFVIFLAPQLFIQAGFVATLKCIVQLLPFFLIQLPYQLITIDILTPRQDRPPFHAHASLFTSTAIRCVRHAFAHLPASFGRVVFSKPVSLPFACFRMLRHGYWPFSAYGGNPNSPLPMQSSSGPATAMGLSWPARLAFRLGLRKLDCHFEEKILDKDSNLKGLWLIKDPTKKPDVVVYYLHGGGFSMGSSWFYLEFLMAWVDLLASPPSPPLAPGRKAAGTKSENGRGNEGTSTGRAYKNPALFALDYTLVPFATFPTQLEQTLAGYDFVLSTLSTSDSGPSPSTNQPPIALAGDSAGATLALSLLLLLRKIDPDFKSTTLPPSPTSPKRPLPHHTTLISPWCRLLSPLNHDTPSDYLNRSALHLYARQYVGLIDGSVSDSRLQFDGGVGDRRYRPNNKEGQVRSNNKESQLHSINKKDEIQSKEAAEEDALRIQNPLASPGDCTDSNWWARATPTGGIHFVHGAEEAFARESWALAGRIESALVDDEEERGADSSMLDTEGGEGMLDTEGGERMRNRIGKQREKDRGRIKVTEEPGQIHAWPVVMLFLGDGRWERLKGLVGIVEEMRRRMQVDEDTGGEEEGNKEMEER